MDFVYCIGNTKQRAMKNLGIALMVIGLIIMVAAYLKTGNLFSVLAGLLVTGLGSIISQRAKRQG